MDKLYVVYTVGEPGTLYQLKVTLQRLDIGSSVRNSYHAHSAFIKLLLPVFLSLTKAKCFKTKK